LTKPEWLSTPSGDDMAKVYPPRAQRMNQAGAASIRCTIDTAGSLQDCVVVRESPAGFGFGAAALSLAAYFKMKPAQRDGRPIKSVLTIPIRFALAGQTNVAAEAEPPLPPPTSPAALELARQVLALQGMSAGLKAQSQPAVAVLLGATVLKGDAKFDTVALEAFQQGLDDVVAAVIERHAQVMAAAMTEAQLRATLDYLESPAGSAWRAAGIAVTPSPDFLSRLAEAASKRLCRAVACDAAGQPVPPPPPQPPKW
jgi:TonB family protein